MSDLLDDFDTVSDEIESERGTNLRATLLSTGHKPDVAARANNIADKRGLPFGVVADNLGDFEEQDRADGIASIGKQNRVVGDFLSDPRRMALAGEDAPNLDALSREIGDGGPDSFFGRTVYSLFGPLMQGDRGRLLSENLDDFSQVVGSSTRSALAAVNEWAAERERDMAAEAGSGSSSAQVRHSEAERADSAQRRQQAGAVAEQIVAEYPDNSAGYHAMGVARSLPIIGAAAITRSPTIGGLLIGGTTAAEQRSNALADGATTGQATASGIAHGALEGTLDAVTLGIARWGVGPVKDALVRRFGEGVATRMLARASATAPGRLGLAVAEGAATEIPTTVGQMASDEAILGTDYTADDYLRGIRDSAIQGGAVSGAVYTATAPLRGLARRMEDEQLARAMSSADGAARLQAITETSATVRLGELSPADLESFVAQAGGDGHVYLPAEQAQVLFQSEFDLAGLVGGQDVLAEQMAGGDLAIPMAKWVAVVSRLPNAQDIARQARMDPDDLSPAELEALDVDAVLGSLGDEDVAPSAPDAADPRQRIQDDVMAQLTATGRYTPAQADAQAQVWSAAIGRLGEMTGQDPAALYQRYMAGVQTGAVAPAPDARVLQQGSVELDFGDRPDEDLDTEYTAMPATEGGRRLDTDLVRELSSEYRADRTLAPRVHKAASAFTKARFARMLAAPVAEGRDNAVLFTAGGGGSGKSTAAERVVGQSNADIIYDGSLSNLARARADIEAALATGRDVRIVYVYRSPANSAAGAIGRAIRSRRPVPVSVLAEAHANAGKVVKALTEEYADNARVEIIAINNDGAMQDADRMPISSIPEVSQDEAESIFRASLEEARAAGALDEPLYAAFDGRTSDAQVGAADDRRNEGIREEREAASRYAVTQDPAAGGVPASEGGILDRLADGIRTLFQRRPAEGAERGQISIFPDRRMAISLFENADLSTFLHESGHFFLEVYRDIAAQPDAPANIKTDFDKLLAWFEVESADQISTEQHEQFARGFEAYLAEGRAPSPSLQAVFSQFRAWLLGIYRTLANLNVELTDDVRGVFDRMLATEEEIAAAQARSGWAPLARDAGEARALGLTEKQFNDYQAMLVAASEEARAEVQSKLEKAHRRAQEAWWKDESAKVREEVEAEFEARPVWRAARILGGAQTLADGSPVPESLAGLKLDRASLVAAGADLKRLSGLYRKEGGVSADEAAMVLGFPSGAALVDSLQGRGTLSFLVRTETDARMRARHGDPMTDGTLPAEAMDAIHINRRVQVLERELGLLAELAGQPRPNRRELTVVARELIARKTPRTIRPNEYLANERRAARESAQAAAAGDYAAALQAKRRQGFNAAMFQQARLAQDEFDKHTRYLRKMSEDAARSRLGKAGADYLEQVDGLLEGLEMRPVSAVAVERRQRLADWVKRQEDAGNPINVPQRLLDETTLTNIRDMPLADVRAVVDTVKQIEHLARLKNKLLLGSEERDRAEVDAEMAASVQAGLTSRPERTGDKTWRDTAGQRVSELDVQRLLPTNIARELDGYQDGGAVWRNVIQPVRDAIYGKVIPAMHVMQDKVAALFNEHYSKDELRQLDAPVYRAEVGDNWSKGRILSLAMNWGSDGNREAILSQAQSRLTADQVGALLATLDARDWAFVQAMVDQVNSYWPEIAEAQRRRTGLVPEKVEASPFPATTADGQQLTIRGGYFPLKYDAERSSYGTTLQEMDQVYNDLRVGRTAKASTRDGHTIERVGSSGKTVALGLDVAQSHMRDVIRDLHLGDAVAYVHNTLHGQQFTEAVTAAGKREHLKALDLWLKDVAAGEMGARNALESVIKFARQNTTAAVLAWKVSSAALQLTGLIQTASIIGRRQTLRGIARLTSKSWVGPHSIWNEIREKSAFMRERFGQIPDAVQSVADARDGRLKAAHSALLRWGYVPMARMQMLADGASWLAAEDKGLHLFDGDVSKARAYADDIVNRAQSPGDFMDKSALSRGTISENIRQTELVKASTMLLSYMIAKGNVAREKYQQTRFTSPMDVAKFSADMVQLFALETMIMALVTNGLPEDEEDDGALDDWLAYLAKEVALGNLATIPLLSQAATEGRGYTAQGVMERAWSQADNATDKFLDDEIDRKDGKAAVNLAGLAFGVPSSQINTTADALWRVHDGEDVSPIEFLVRQQKPRE